MTKLSWGFNVQAILLKVQQFVATIGGGGGKYCRLAGFTQEPRLGTALQAHPNKCKLLKGILHCKGGGSFNMTLPTKATHQGMTHSYLREGTSWKWNKHWTVYKGGVGHPNSSPPIGWPLASRASTEHGSQSTNVSSSSQSFPLQPSVRSSIWRQIPSQDKFQ